MQQVAGYTDGEWETIVNLRINETRQTGAVRNRTYRPR